MKKREREREWTHNQKGSADVLTASSSSPPNLHLPDPPVTEMLEEESSICFLLLFFFIFSFSSKSFGIRRSGNPSICLSHVIFFRFLANQRFLNRQNGITSSGGRMTDTHDGLWFLLLHSERFSLSRFPWRYGRDVRRGEENDDFFCFLIWLTALTRENEDSGISRQSMKAKKERNMCLRIDQYWWRRLHVLHDEGMNEFILWVMIKKGQMMKKSDQTSRHHGHFGVRNPMTIAFNSSHAPSLNDSTRRSYSGSRFEMMNWANRMDSWNYRHLFDPGIKWNNNYWPEIS